MHVLLIGETEGYFTDCIFQDAENDIVVYNRSGCEVKKCKVIDCAKLDIYHKSKLTSWVNVSDTELSETTKKNLYNYERNRQNAGGYAGFLSKNEKTNQ